MTTGSEGSGVERGGSGRVSAGCPRLSWSTFAICVIVAVVLSVMATLLLGGSFRLPAPGAGAPGGCGRGTIARGPGDSLDRAR